MASRLNLQKELESVLGSKNVYFQPPESIKLQFPCIVYEEVKGVSTRADDRLYLYRKAYSLIVIDKNPDSEIPDKVRVLHLCDTGNPYKADNLNHWPFTIYI